MVRISWSVGPVRSEEYTDPAGGDYSRAATIRGRRLIDEIQSKSQQSKIVHFIHKTGCTFAAAFHLNIFYHKLPHISITYI